MKTTVYLGKYHRLTTSPHSEGVHLQIEVRRHLLREQWAVCLSEVMTPDQAGALIFGMEQALEVREQRLAAAMAAAAKEVAL